MNTEKNPSGFRGLVFDLSYDRFLGVKVYLRVFFGKFSSGETIKNANSGLLYKVEIIGVDTPTESIQKDFLTAGEIGWFAGSIRNVKEISVGSTMVEEGDEFNGTLLSPFIENQLQSKPNVFCNVFPEENVDFFKFRKSVEELCLQDTSLTIEQVDSKLLGRGFRCGFVGLLQKEIFLERLRQEFFSETISTPANTSYKITFSDHKIEEINDPAKLQSKKKISKTEELFIELKIITPENCLGNIIILCQNYRGALQTQEKKTNSLFKLVYLMPLSEFVSGFDQQLKSLSQGFASTDYKSIGFFPSEIVKVDILINSELVQDLSFFVHEKKAVKKARELCEDLKNNLSIRTFSLAIQACVGKRIIVRENIASQKKNVTGNLYGGDRTRKMKLWAKQKRGQKKMKELGNVNFSSRDLRKVLRKKG